MKSHSKVEAAYSYEMLGSDDTGLFRQLLSVFRVAFEEADTIQNSTPGDKYLHSLLEKEHFTVIVARNDGAVVGGLVAYELQKYEQERSEIYIYDLAVATRHRRKGVATALIRNLQNEAKKKGADVIFVQADKGDEPAIKLYQSLGIREDVYHFDISVP